ncbi:hypothetical protein B0H13DRAFT_1890040 [Mycena leptocephala]|nr:hypothetical protein B0H13DRAFT_1890040 [Mycena leptocephala]
MPRELQEVETTATNLDPGRPGSAMIGTPSSAKICQGRDRRSFTFIQKMDNISGRADIGAIALCMVMQPLGSMRTLTTILCALGGSPASDIASVLHSYVTFLGINIHTPRMAAWITEGLKHVLLHVILVCADRNSGATYHKLLRLIERNTELIARVESALLGVDDLARSSRLAKLPEWKYFVVVAEEHISILKGLNAVMIWTLVYIGWPGDKPELIIETF